MNISSEKSEKGQISFPWWQYLKQPIFSREQDFIWNPRRFAYLHRINYLERCWSTEYDKMEPPQN